MASAPGQQQQEENSGEGALGEFQHIPVVTHAEVQILLEEYVAQQQRFRADWQPSPMITKVSDYVTRFTTVKNKETAHEVRAAIAGYELTDFELGCIADLMPETADEAKALVPSLKTSGKSDEELQAMLDSLQQFKRFE